MKINWKKEITNLVSVLLANAFLAFSFVMFILPLNIISGGMGGIGVILNAVFGLDPTIIIFILAWSLFALGWLMMGTKFALKTLLSTIIYPIFVYLFTLWDSLEAITATLDAFIGVVYGGIIGGIGVGLSFRAGGSTGGVDNLGMAAQKLFGWKVEQVIFVIDATIIVAGGIFVSIEGALMGVLAAFISMVLIDKVVVGSSSSILVYIISNKHELLNKEINMKLGRGTTLIPSQGGFTKEKKMTIQTVVSHLQYQRLRTIVNSLDPDAFMIVTNAQEVFGLGFKSMRSGV